MRLSIIAMTLILSSCAQFYTGRSYLNEMDHDDTAYFDAGSDFPVIGGDTGRTWRSDNEQRKRTPASEDEIAERRGKRLLQEELRGLEESQTEHGAKIYELHRKKFGSVSEKIYFLKLTQTEKHQYLSSRGFLNVEQPRVLTPHERMHAKRKSGIMPGMTKDDVQGTWGKPLRVEVAGNPSYENERWVYSYNGATKYIYFEGGRVEGWE